MLRRAWLYINTQTYNSIVVPNTWNITYTRYNRNMNENVDRESDELLFSSDCTASKRRCCWVLSRTEPSKEFSIVYFAARFIQTLNKQRSLRYIMSIELSLHNSGISLQSILNPVRLAFYPSSIHFLLLRIQSSCAYSFFFHFIPFDSMKIIIHSYVPLLFAQNDLYLVIQTHIQCLSWSLL